MYHYVEDKDFLNRMKSLCAGIVNQLVQNINNDSVMTVRASLVGSGAKNLVTQNANEPIDLDYNIIIVDAKSINIRDGRRIKEYIRNRFNKILNKNGWDDCQDSTSVLTTERRTFTKGVKTAFSIDLAIVYEDEYGWHRLIHGNRTGIVLFDGYYWNQMPQIKGLQKKVADIKSCGLWWEVRETYLNKKNFYLCRNDENHPSFVIYIETVNQVYDKYLC